MGIRTILDNNAMGIEIKKRTHFFIIETGSRYANIDPRARNAIKERNPEQGFPTSRGPAGIKILNPSRYIGMPNTLIIHTPALAAKILSGKETRPITASGNGNINTRKRSGNHMILDTSLPNRKSDKPMIRKKMENPEMEKIYSSVPRICRNKAKNIIINPITLVLSFTLASLSFCR